MSNVVPTDWQTDHLFVLVGGNPLPNFVAGQLLLKERGTLHLVHSASTTPVAHRLAAFFPGHYFHEIQDPSNGVEIAKVIKTALRAIPKAERAGLHYTGGTKAMAVHAHAAFRAGMASRGTPGVLTYLDAATLSLRRDDQWHPKPVQFAVTPQIETLLQLHGIELAHSPKREVWFERLNRALVKAHQSRKGQKAYAEWCQQNLRQKEGKNKGRLVERKGDLPQPRISYPDTPALVQVADAMRKAFGEPGADFDPESVMQNWEVGPKKLKDFIFYLDGGWLEHWVLQNFIELAAPCQLHDYAMSLDTKETPYNFELDVAAMQGYQLYAVSCTRSSARRLGKSKLFEALVRGAQLGGDEANVGLVCCNGNPEIIEQQATKLWGAERGKIRVFGANDLVNLSEQFKEWFSC